MPQAAFAPPPEDSGYCPSPASGPGWPIAVGQGWGGAGPVVISRWLFGGGDVDEVLTAKNSDYVISLSLRATRLEMRCGAGAVFDGVMRAGTVHVTGPGQTVAARISAPCDVLHLHVPTGLLRQRLETMGACDTVLHDLEGRTMSDALVEQLAKLLLTDAAGSDPVYSAAIVQTLLTRVLHMARSRAPAGALAKWRLRRVQAMIEARLAEPLTLHDLAAAAGLSRMHFAAQFRAATGSSPHVYLLCQRIESAKLMLATTDTPLAEIALDVGFLAQAHFTTVFKRLTSTTPAQWRKMSREIPQRPPSPRTPPPEARFAGHASEGARA